MLTTLVKFLHSGPALGFVELEYAQYTVSMWEMTPEFDVENEHSSASCMQSAVS